MANSPRLRRWLLLVLSITALSVVLCVHDRPVLLPRVASLEPPAPPIPRGQKERALPSDAPASPAPRAASPKALFAFVAPAGGTAALDAALPAPTRKLHYVRLNLPLINGKQSPFWQKPGAGQLELPLPDGSSLPVVIMDTQTLGPDRFTSTGTIPGRPGSRAIFAYNQGFMHASVEDPELGTYALRAATQEVSQFFEIDPALVSPCGGSVHPVIDSDAITTLAKQGMKSAQAPKSAGDAVAGGAGNDATTPTTAAAAGANVEVHLMFAYTQSVLTTLAGSARTNAILSAIDAAVAQVNADFSASLISARVKLVKTAETSYDENAGAGGTVQQDALEALRRTTDGQMDELHALRDSSGADLVCLLINRDDTSGTIGIAYILDTPGSNINPLYGFSVVQYSHLSTGEHVVPHELGHNFGCAHDREHSSSQGAYSYSYGYRFLGQDGRTYRDIMSYQPGTLLAYYSTPRVTAGFPVNQPVGIAAGLPGEADNARTIEQGAFEVANFRLQAQAAFSAGTLQAVSTRALVGAGDQQLIGGFIITGSQKKKVLIRAAGPVLAPFLSNFLRDPFLTINNVNVSPAVVVATNDNWEANNPNHSEITGLANGSKDAALLLTLDPGAYTANVTAADGGTGIARIDAYEADGGGARLYALSTRAYATVADPAIAGFVVGGAAGTTKRMLIRVRGPSMARDFGLAGAMNDPYMEIYNGTGDLVFINDDWSSGSNTPDDFTPYVTLYNEQQIANSQQLYETGLAPANRREPAVMADFAPGNYTVVIKPFERLPDQPSQPGVAAVDVFEIKPR